MPIWYPGEAQDAARRLEERRAAILAQGKKPCRRCSGLGTYQHYGTCYRCGGDGIEHARLSKR